jgi:uncharacterized protein
MIKLSLRVQASLVVLAAATAAPFGQADAASFDCTKANTAVERWICADAALSRSDDSVASLYRRALKADPETSASQRAWLRQRNECASSECVRKAYGKRTQELKTALGETGRAEARGSSASTGPAKQPPSRVSPPPTSPTVQHDAVAEDLLTRNATSILRCFHPSVDFVSLSLSGKSVRGSTGVASGVLTMKGVWGNYQRGVELEYDPSGPSVRVTPGGGNTRFPPSSSCGLRNWGPTTGFVSSANASVESHGKTVDAVAGIAKAAVAADAASRQRAEAREAQRREAREAQRREASSRQSEYSASRGAERRTCEQHKSGCLAQCEGMQGRQSSMQMYDSQRDKCRNQCNKTNCR